ncbi:MAG: 2-oxo acid dehydrogenase subunit E2 [Chloroflexi bacterium]|nr:2-oxo acid dehydrogenase subunit E2 [Chloroflexota bacterium]
MATRVVMPQMGYDMQEGTLVRWLKQEGEAVHRGEVIAEIETDKAVVEMEAYASGVLLKAVIAEGATTPVGETIAFIGEAGETVPEWEASPGPSPRDEAKVEVAEGDASAPARAEAEETAEGAEEAPSSARQRGRVRASPLARSLAEEKGIDLAQVNGSGPGGRVSRDDVLAFMERGVEAPRIEEAPVEEETSEIVPLSRMRQAIARRTAQSKREAPHFYVTAEVDMTRAMALRQEINQALGDEVRVSVNDIIVKACAQALVKHPTLNASFEEDHLRVHREINIGIAIALEAGLIIASLGDCRHRSLTDVARASKSVVERAQSGVMRAEDYTGSTFSISNMGMFDVDSFSAIIYPPQAAVVAVGTVRKRPVVRDDQVTIAQVMQAILSTDHRIADGAQAARFMVEVKHLLENPVSLLV